jgi:transposase InsO family protein
MQIPGERIQVDVKYVPKACLTGALSHRKLYQYTAIDECTRWRYIAIYDELNPQASKRFVEELRKRFPFEILCIQTDNGCEFTSKLQGAQHPSAFESHLASEGIRHKTIAIATPRHNGKVERSHREDQKRLYSRGSFYSLSDFRVQLTRHQYRSNNFPMRPLHWLSPIQFLDNLTVQDV